MDKQTGLIILRKAFTWLSGDEIAEVVCFAAGIREKQRNPDTLKKRLITAREQVEVLGALEAVLGDFTKKGNRSANTWLAQTRVNLEDWKTVLKEREEEWRKFTGTTPDDAPDLVGALRRIADEKPCLDFRRCEDYGYQAAEVARAALSSLSDRSDLSDKE